MNDSIQDAARRILDNLRRTHQGNMTFVPAQEAEFGHLDLEHYRRLRAALEKQGFRHLCDLEILEVTNAPGTLLARTFIRALASADGAIAAEYYQVRPRLGRLLQLLLKGLLNGRWLAAPRMALAQLSTKHCCGFDTELSDGTFITTSNAQAAGLLSLPASVQSEFFPYGTGVAFLLQRHREKLAAALAATPGVRAVPVRTQADLLATQARLKQKKDAHRAALNWVSREEMQRFAGNRELAEAVYAEVQRQLATLPPAAPADGEGTATGA